MTKVNGVAYKQGFQCDSTAAPNRDRVQFLTIRDPVAFLLFVSLLAIVFRKGNEGYNQEEYEYWKTDVRDDFADLDQNKDDYVDTAEFSIEHKPVYTEYAFKKYDANGDGKMNYEEFIDEWLNWGNSGFLPSEIFKFTDIQVYQKSGNETVLDRT